MALAGRIHGAAARLRDGDDNWLRRLGGLRGLSRRRPRDQYCLRRRRACARNRLFRRCGRVCNHVACGRGDAARGVTRRRGGAGGRLLGRRGRACHLLHQLGGAVADAGDLGAHRVAFEPAIGLAANGSQEPSQLLRQRDDLLFNDVAGRFAGD